MTTQNNFLSLKPCSLISHEGGTVKDINNNLIWLGAPYGMNFQNGMWWGEPKKYTWYEAVDMFGKGTAVYDRSIDMMGHVITNSLMKSSIRNGYTQGERKVHIVGYSNWRLPTLEESLNLRRNSKFFHDFLHIDVQDEEEYRTIFKKLFSPFYDTSASNFDYSWQKHWLANSCGLSPLSFNPWNKKVWAAWRGTLGFDSECPMDTPPETKLCLLLVRNDN